VNASFEGGGSLVLQDKKLKL